MRIYLIGFMGSGKSRAGRVLAERLDMPLLDLDQRIEAEAGKSIAEIFRSQGEAEFRSLEASCLRQTLQQDPVVVACGGGAPCHSGNMAWMNAAGLTIFLDPPLDTLVRRLLPGRAKRPLLSHLPDAEALRAFIAPKLAERRPFYEQAAVHVQPPPSGSGAEGETGDLVLDHILDITGH